jgi:glycerol-3-phosphate acyltransferase PlsY
VLFGLAWPAGIAMCLIWLATAALTRYSSLAALVASFLTPGVLLAFGERPEALLFTILTAMLWIMHRSNIARLIAGTEGRIGERSAAGG